MKVERSYVTCRVVEATEEEWVGLRDLLSYPEVTFAGGARRVKMVPMLDVRSARFPSGLLPKVAAWCVREGFLLEVRDLRAKPVEDLSVSWAWLRDYQRDAAEALLAAGNGIAQAPTASGKTELACALMARVREPWLFVAHREELARQAGARFHDRTGEAPGFALAGEWAPARCTFATFATLTAALKSDKHQGRAEKLLSGVRGLIVDECHTLGARTHLRVVSEASRAFYRIGLSATPLGRTDGKSLHVIGYLGPVVWSRTSGEMADAGMTTPVEVTFIRCDQPGIAAGRDWNRARAYASVYRRGVVESEARNALLVRMAAACPRPWLLFVKRLDHAKRLTKALRDSGLRVGEATGKTPNRGGVLDKLRFGEVDGVVCNVVFQEGVDVPALAGLVIGTGDKSGIAAIQRIGRGTRRADGKSTLTVFDVADGLPWVGDHAKERARIYKREGYALKLAEGVDAIRPAEEGTP